MSLELQKIWIANRKTVFFITQAHPESVFPLRPRAGPCRRDRGGSPTNSSFVFRGRAASIRRNPEFNDLVSAHPRPIGASVDV